MKTIILTLLLSIVTINAQIKTRQCEGSVSRVEKHQISEMFIKSVVTNKARDLVASCSGDGLLKIFNVQQDGNLTLFKEFKHEEFVLTAAFINDDKQVASAGWDKIIRIFDLESGELLSELKGHEDWISSLKYSAKYNLLFSGSADKTVKAWDTKAYELKKTFDEHQGIVFGLDVTDETGLLISTSQDKLFMIYDIATLLFQFQVKGHDDTVTAGKFFNDDRLTAVTVSWDNNIQVWSLKQQQQVISLLGHDQPISQLDIIEFDGFPVLVTGSEDKTIKLWDLQKMIDHDADFFQLEDFLIQKVESEDFVWGVNFIKVQDTYQLISSGEDGALYQWKVDLKQNCSLKKTEL